jgi:MFS family permease
MTWVAWRTHRAVLLTVVALAAVVVLAFALSPVGVVLADPFGLTDNPLADWFGLLVLVAPVLFGVFVGAPLLAADLERGSHVLLLSQSVGRARWALTSLAVVGVPAVLASAAFAWVYGAVAVSEPWYDAAAVLSRGLLPVAYGLFAVVSGAAVGLWLRRVLPAAAVTLALVAVVEVLVGLVRPVLLPATRVEGPIPPPSLTAGTWVQARGYVTADGTLVATQYRTAFPPAGATGGMPCASDDTACFQEAGIRGTWTTFHAESARWSLHWVEVAVLVGLTLVALAAILLRLRRPLGRR